MSTRRAWRPRNIPVPEAHTVGLVLSLAVNLCRPRRLRGPAAVRVGGVVLLAAGTAVVVWATTSAGTNDLEQPDRLVTGGPYALSRNPMYVGWTLIYLGAAAVGDTAWPLVLLPGVATIMHREVRREEARLKARFGSEFDAYVVRVRRYL